MLISEGAIMQSPSRQIGVVNESGSLSNPTSVYTTGLRLALHFISALYLATGRQTHLTFRPFAQPMLPLTAGLCASAPNLDWTNK